MEPTMPTQFSNRPIRLLLAMTVAVAASPVFADTGFPGGDYAAGQIVLHFEPSGHMRLTKADQVLVAGDYTVQADRISLTDRSGPMACEKGQETGVYHWKLEHDALTLTKVDDACDGRSGDLAAQTWKRQR
jgi:hypothetical protein